MAAPAPPGANHDGWLDANSHDIGGGTRALASLADPALPAQLEDDDSQIVSFASADFFSSGAGGDALALLLTLATLGLPALAATWWPRLRPKVSFWRRAQRTDVEADRVVVASLDGIVSVAEIMVYNPQVQALVPIRARKKMGKIPVNAPRMFVWREERFWYSSRDGHWTRRAFKAGSTYAEIHALAARIAAEDAPEGGSRSSKSQRMLTYGPNTLHVHVPSFKRLVMEEAFKPFFLFQVFSVTSWLFLDYATYAYIIIVLTVLAVLYSAYETWSSLTAVKRLAQTDTRVRRLALKKGAGLALVPEEVSSADLLPGDLVEVEAGMAVPCDLILLAGQCVVSEAMLTGESAPVLKSALPPDVSPHSPEYSPLAERDARYRLMAGTQVLQTRRARGPPLPLPPLRPAGEGGEGPLALWQLHAAPQVADFPVAAMVAGTSYATAKGQLIRAILFPKPAKYDFERKLYYFVANLVVFLVFSCSLVIIWQWNKKTPLQVLLEVVNLITITVPPQLPLALSIGLSASFDRLQRQGIRCLHPARILAGGRVSLTAFDKTGTLTEEGLSLRGVCLCHVAASERAGELHLAPLEENIQGTFVSAQKAALSSSRQDSYLAQCQLALFHSLASCHSISVMAEPPAKLTSSRGGLEDDASSTASLPTSTWQRLTGRLTSLWKGDSAMDYKRQGAPSAMAAAEEETGEGPPEKYIGDPLEVEMFSATGWTFLTRPEESSSSSSSSSSPLSPLWHHPHVHASVDVIVTPPGQLADVHSSLAILRRFDFDSDLRLMSAVVVELRPRAGEGETPKMWLLTKGAPESVQERCVAESVPSNFEAQLQELALNGDRVLACAMRPLDGLAIETVLRAPRARLEAGLALAGLAALENRLKAGTRGALRGLALAGLRAVMVTGDAALTAVAVARKCGPYFLRAEATFLVDARPRDAGDGPGDAGDATGTGCVLRDLSTLREADLDTLLGDLPQAGADVEAGISALRQPWLAGGVMGGVMGGVTAAGGRGGAGVSLAVTGRAFSALAAQHAALARAGRAVYGEGHVAGATALEMVAARAGVFARMTPRNKLDLVYCLQDLGYTVCMTGDGANDSSALKAADVGISIASSLKQEDNSVAAAPSIAAPFSTHIDHIGVVAQVLSEGRCALVNATTMFKYMYFYALIQTTAVVILYNHDEDMGQYQYLYGDLFVVFTLILVLPGTAPNKQLTRGRPEGNLLALPVLVSVYGQSALLVAFQVGTYLFLQSQTWYVNTAALASTTNGVFFYSQDCTVMFLISSFQYTTIAMALSQSFGLFRAPVWSNRSLCIALALQLITSSVLVLSPPSFALSLFSMVDLLPHRDFLLCLFLLALANGACFILFERMAVRHVADEPDAIDPSELALRPLPLSRSSSEKGKKDLPRFVAVQKISEPFWSSLASTK